MCIPLLEYYTCDYRFSYYISWECKPQHFILSTFLFLPCHFWNLVSVQADPNQTFKLSIHIAGEVILNLHFTVCVRYYRH